MIRSLRAYAQRIGDFLRDTLFPRQCLGCGVYDTWLCPSCDRLVEFPTQLRCFGCNRPSPDGRFCIVCESGRSLRGLWFVAPYQHPLTRSAIHTLKYHGAYDVVKALVPWMTTYMQQWPFLFTQPTCYVPVPLHHRRERTRGFNQSHILLAAWLQNTQSGTCGCWLLKRTRGTKVQANLDRDARQENVQNAFCYAGVDTLIPSQRIVLVDDVATTGATLEECAQTLATAGFRDIWGFVLAKG
jgi:ComF family protein